MTKRSDAGDSGRSDRKYVAVSLDFTLRPRLRDAAAAHDWSMGDLALALAAEHGGTVTSAREGLPPVKRLQRENPTVVVGLYMTPDEIEELDEVARRCQLTRSALVETAVRLGLGEEPAVALAPVLQSEG